MSINWRGMDVSDEELDEIYAQQEYEREALMEKEPWRWYHAALIVFCLLIWWWIIGAAYAILHFGK